MDQLLETRQKIYDYFQSSDACQEFFFNCSREERYAAYYTSMYLISDATESIRSHRRKGFSKDPLEAYLEFWGVMQAITIQQDSICELYKAVNDKQLHWKGVKSWEQIRELRHICAGHPAKKDRPKKKPLTRTFMARGFGNYSSFYYEQWEKPMASPKSNNSLDNITHPKINLGKLIDEYSEEATNKLVEILQSMKEQWPAV